MENFGEALKKRVENEAERQISEYVDKGGSFTYEKLHTLKENRKMVYHDKIIQ